MKALLMYIKMKLKKWVGTETESLIETNIIIKKDMSRCTAPRYGHRTASGAANCPACSNRYRSYNSYSSPYSLTSSNSINRKTGSINSRNIKARWAKLSSTIYYTPSEIRTLTPIRDNIEKRSSIPDLRDVFLCHAWDDRKEAAKVLNDLLEAHGVSVWFSEKDVLLGSSILREIDKGLAKSRVGIVLVTPSFLKRVNAEGIADKELSALLARDLLVPIVHNTSFEELREVSPLLGSRSGLSTTEESLENVVAKLAELVKVQQSGGQHLSKVIMVIKFVHCIISLHRQTSTLEKYVGRYQLSSLYERK